MKSFVERRALFVVLGCAVLFACSDRGGRELAKQDGASDRLQVALIFAEGTALDEVFYTATHPDNGTSRTGRAKLSASSKFDLQLGSFPLSSGYSLELTGVTTAGEPCMARGIFDVVSGAVITLPLSMGCDASSPAQESARRGGLRANAGVHASGVCPDVSGIGAAPLDVPLGAPLKIEGFATSPTQTRWNFPGFVAAPYAWTTRAYCTQAGTQTLTFETLTPGCPPRTGSIDIACSEDSVARCGNSLLDPGEECDDGNLAAGDGCSDCRRESPACAVDFPCLERTAFCVGTAQMRMARTIPCAELCGAGECLGAGCGPTGPVIDCPAGEICVDDESLPYWEHDARCMPVPSHCEDSLCPLNYTQCGRVAPTPESCSQACTVGFCCTWRANDWVKVAVECGEQ